MREGVVAGFWAEECGEVGVGGGGAGVQEEEGGGDGEEGAEG